MDARWKGGPRPGVLVMARASRRRLDFEQLLLLQDVLDVRLVLGELSPPEHELEWTSLLSVSGYTSSEYELGIDDRWDRLTALRTARTRKRGLA